MKNLLKKFLNKETILYGIFGIGTSMLNVVLFQLLLMTSMDYKIANLITLIVVKVAAYICNKNFVFQSHCDSFAELLKEIFRFIVARGATMIIDYVGLIIMVDLCSLPELPSKIFITVLVIVINYIVGKKHVFKK
ncbi:MAG: GtrA family protein [Lachnospiraceae bacterium]|nr:GtrA family protein [Lachnospiraceae bacterium]MBO5176757.1 GtrA family protein [Lachnospiraceae bacterium]